MFASLCLTVGVHAAVPQGMTQGQWQTSVNTAGKRLDIPASARVVEDDAVSELAGRAGCTAVFKGYTPAAWEQQWADNVDAWQHDMCAVMSLQMDRYDEVRKCGCVAVAVAVIVAVAVAVCAAVWLCVCVFVWCVLAFVWLWNAAHMGTRRDVGCACQLLRLVAMSMNKAPDTVSCCGGCSSAVEWLGCCDEAAMAPWGLRRAP